MRYMEHIDGVLSLIDREFAEMEQNGKFRSRDEVELAYKMMDIVKDAAEFCEKQAEMDQGYSEYGYPRHMYPYDNGVSYERGRNRNSMGQYSRDSGMSYYSNRGYSRDDAKSGYLSWLKEKEFNAPDEHTRNYIQRMIQEMERD